MVTRGRGYYFVWLASFDRLRPMKLGGLMCQCLYTVFHPVSCANNDTMFTLTVATLLWTEFFKFNVLGLSFHVSQTTLQLSVKCTHFGFNRMTEVVKIRTRICKQHRVAAKPPSCMQYKPPTIIPFCPRWGLTPKLRFWNTNKTENFPSSIMSCTSAVPTHEWEISKACLYSEKKLGTAVHTPCPQGPKMTWDLGQHCTLPPRISPYNIECSYISIANYRNCTNFYAQLPFADQGQIWRNWRARAGPWYFLPCQILLGSVCILMHNHVQSCKFYRFQNLGTPVATSLHRSQPNLAHKNSPTVYAYVPWAEPRFTKRFDRPSYSVALGRTLSVTPNFNCDVLWGHRWSLEDITKTTLNAGA